MLRKKVKQAMVCELVGEMDVLDRVVKEGFAD